MTMTITPLDAPLGAEVSGVDLGGDVDAEQRSALNAAFVTYHVLVFRGQHLDPPGFKRAVGLFGTIMPQENDDTVVPGHPDVHFVSNYEGSGDGGEQAEAVKKMVPGAAFHTDHSNHARPPKATALYAVELPSSGGDTQFVNANLAYEDLSDQDKALIDHLEVVHTYLSSHGPRKLSPERVAEMTAKNPPSVHPLVRVHPDTGGRSLYLNPVRMESILGMPDDDARSLLARLAEHATQPKYEYRHQWTLGDLVVWDNRCVLHKANGDYDMTQRRYLYRLLLEGEAPLGISSAA